MHAKAEHYRKQADHCRKLAKSIRDADAKAHMLDVSRQYEKLAAEADERGA